MSKFNVEAALSDLSKKVAALTVNISAQSTLIEAQNKKIEDQQRTIDSNSTTISELTKVVGELSANIENLVKSKGTSKGEIDALVEVQATQRASETHIGAADVPALSQNNVNVTDRTRRAKERSKTKGALTQRKINEQNNTADKNVTLEVSVEDKIRNSSDEWKRVSYQKKTRKVSNAIRQGGNAQISTFQAIQKKKFLHVWSLHPDTSEEAITEHVKSICETDDVKVNKIIPKSKRDYSSFMVGVPESRFEKVNSVDSWPVNTQFNEWVWFRNSQKSAKGVDSH